VIEKFYSCERFADSVRRVPDYISENSVSDLFFDVANGFYMDLNLYLDTVDVEEGRAMYYEGRPLIMPEMSYLRELHQTDIIEGYLQQSSICNGDVVVDAGAFPGEFMIHAANQVGEEGCVLALEPDEENFSDLNRVVNLNDLENVITAEVGLYSENGNVGFSPDPNLSSEIDISGDVRIDVRTLDSLVEEMDVSPDFVKMDIEGAELDALGGAGETLSNDRPSVAVATYHEVDGRQTADRVEEILSSYGYETDTGFEEHQTTWGIP
jgi:FkbM family methyltransferase